MSSWRHVVLTVALVTIVGIAAVVANLALLRTTEDNGDPVGRLSPRAVFAGGGSPDRATPASPGRGDRHGSTTPDD